MNLKPTTAQEICEQTRETVTCESTGRIFVVQAINPMAFYDIGILQLPTAEEAVRYEQSKSDPSLLNEDEKSIMTEMLKGLVHFGVVSLTVIIDPNVKPDPKKNEIHYYQLTADETIDICKAVDRLSGFGIWKSEESPWGRDKKPERVSEEERAQASGADTSMENEPSVPMPSE